MKLDVDDPRLTAYALGDLPESERQAMEMELQQSPECREAVEEIRQTAKALSDQFAAEPCPALSPEQRDAIRKKLEPANVVHLPRRKIFATVGLTALAACIAGVLAWQFWFVTPEDSQTAAVSHSQNFAPPKVQTSTPQNAVAFKPPEQPAASAPKQTVLELSTDPLLAQSPEPWMNERQYADAKNEVAAELKRSTEILEAVQKQKDASDLYRQNQSLQLGRKVQRVAMNEGTANNISLGSDVKTVNLGINENKPGAARVDNYYRKEPPAAGAPPASSRYRITTDTAALVATTETVPGLKNEEESLGRLADESTRHLPVRGEVRNQDAWFGGKETPDTAKYPHLTENTFVTVRNSPLSTFSIDVDTASYANVRRFLNEGRMPPRDAVRIEEMINYFSYQYPQPKGDDPFSASIEVAGCPWNSEHRLVRLGLKGREIARDKRPPSNFVFLIDVSGSMQPRERLPLIKQALRQLVKKMTENDHVAIVVYANNAGVRLESTSCSEKEKILEAIDELTAGGGTNGGDGIQQAYRMAEENFIRGGVNRVLLCTDGDFNVGTTDQKQLVHMIQEKAKSGVFLTTLGVGTDNYKDALMQKLADKGNGNYHYLDTLEEAQKVLIEQMSGTLTTIAKDVKIQIEFNPARVNAYRLIGYEKRLLRQEDFNNDAKDAGEIGAGHTVTALYEIVPAGTEIQGAVNDLKYQYPAEEKPERYVEKTSRELLTLKLRYKQPDGDRSRLLEFPVTDGGKRLANASPDFKFAAAVASFGMLLRDSEYKGDFSYGAALELAAQAKGADENGYRAEFLTLVRKARELRR